MKDEWRCVMTESGRQFVTEGGMGKKQRWFAHSSTIQIHQVHCYIHDSHSFIKY